jgi:hypothetical protein
MLRANGPGALDLGLNQRMISSQNHFTYVNAPIMILNQTPGQFNPQSVTPGGAKAPNKADQSSFMEKLSDDEVIDEKKDRIWDQLEDEVNDMNSNDEDDQKGGSKGRNKKEKYDKDLDINHMIMRGNIQVQPQKNQDDEKIYSKKKGKKKSKTEVNRLERGGKKQKQEQAPAKEPTTNNDKPIETKKKGFFGDSED